MLRALRSLSLTWWIFIGMGAGILIGWLAPEFAATLKPLSTIFLRMIKSVVVPIIFGTLVVGIAGHGDDLKRIGRLARQVDQLLLADDVAWRSPIGLVAVNLTRPGVGRGPPAARSQRRHPHGRARPPSADFSSTSCPGASSRPRRDNEVLQVVFWATLFAIALTQVRGKPKEAMLGFCEGLAEVMFKFVGIVMRFAPIGIGAAMAVTVSHSGIQVLKNLGLLVATLYGALIVFALVALLPAALLARIPIRRFFARGQGPGDHRVHDHVVRRRAAARHAADDRVRRAAADRRVRHADRLLVQPRRLDALPRRRVDLRGAGGRRGSHGRASSW